MVAPRGSRGHGREIPGAVVSRGWGRRLTQVSGKVQEKPSPNAYYVTSMLFLVLAISLIDCNILGILLADINGDLGVLGHPERIGDSKPLFAPGKRHDVK